MVAASVAGQTNISKRQYIPWLDRASQENVVVNFWDAEGQQCPWVYTNSLSNTNLFTQSNRLAIEEVFGKYRTVTTNTGPEGTVLVGLRKTNYVSQVLNQKYDVENWVAQFAYTNLDAREEIVFGKGISAKFRTAANDGYNIFFVRTGIGTMLRFTEIKNGLVNGVLAEFDDLHPQGTNWDFRAAKFANSCLVEYRQYTNGLVFGKYLLWNPRNDRLLLDADIKEPYDWNRHYRPSAVK